MAITPVAFTSGITTGATSTSTASKTWVAGNVYFLWVLSVGTVPTVTVGDTSWTLIDSVGPAAGLQWSVLRFVGDGSTGAATISFGTTSQSHIQWTCDEVQGLDTSAPVVQSNGATGGTTTATAALVAFADPVNNATYAGAANSAGAAETVKAGYTPLSSNNSFFVLLDEFNLGQDTAPSIGSASTWLFIAMELKAAGVVSGGSNDLTDALIDSLILPLIEPTLF